MISGTKCNVKTCHGCEILGMDVKVVDREEDLLEVGFTVRN